MVTGYTGHPDRVGETDDVAGEFPPLACLTYGRDDGPERWAAAATLLAGNPGIAASSFFAAAAVADTDQVRRFLDADSRAICGMGC
jgi:hypothetical protein